MSVWKTVPVLFLVLALAACGTDEEVGLEETIEEIDEAIGVDTLEEPGREGPPPQRVVIQAASYAYQPSEIAVAPGEVRFIVTNAAEIVHGFEVEGHGMEEAIHEIPAGTTDSLTATFEQPGEYEIYCPVDDHRQRGMTGRLVVQEPTP